MINAPKAQLERRVIIHRLDTDPDEAWDGLLDLLAETDGLKITKNKDGTVMLWWHADNAEVEMTRDEVGYVDEFVE